MTSRDFSKEAATWEENPGRVKISLQIAEKIISDVKLTEEMNVLDFGCGTGIISFAVQPYIRSVTCADSASGMLEIIKQKILKYNTKNVSTFLLGELTDASIDKKYELIICSMTLHHIENTADIIRKFNEMLIDSGVLCIADLDAEDGTFHDNSDGIFHFGFDRNLLKEILAVNGFTNVTADTAAEVLRPDKNGNLKKYPIFLITAKKSKLA